MRMVEGSASIVINRPAPEVFAAVVDITRMGEWSPECIAGRWVPPATGPALGARFEGDNAATAGPLTLKRWTTTSEITAYAPNELFEFVAESYTTWRYELAELDGATSGSERECAWTFGPFDDPNHKLNSVYDVALSADGRRLAATTQNTPTSAIPRPTPA